MSRSTTGPPRRLARRCRGTPRIANRLLRRVRDYAQVRADGRITHPVAQTALNLLDVDRYGLDEIDQKIMLTVLEKYRGGPVGVNTIAASISEEAGHHRRSLRAVSDSARLSESHAPRPCGHRVWRTITSTSSASPVSTGISPDSSK